MKPPPLWSQQKVVAKTEQEAVCLANKCPPVTRVLSSAVYDYATARQTNFAVEKASQIFQTTLAKLRLWSCQSVAVDGVVEGKATLLDLESTLEKARSVVNNTVQDLPDRPFSTRSLQEDIASCLKATHMTQVLSRLIDLLEQNLVKVAKLKTNLTTKEVDLTVVDLTATELKTLGDFVDFTSDSDDDDNLCTLCGNERQKYWVHGSDTEDYEGLGL